MKNISFDNPYWLLIAIPLLLLTVVPFVIAIRKDNKSGAATASLIIHILIISLVSLGLAGMISTTVMTETDVYIVADVSYSSNRNLDKIDAYIASVKENLPENSKLGIVCFGKDHTVLTEMGGEIKSVKEAKVDDTSTDIASALDHTATLFGKNVIKRIILITDGKQAERDAVSRLINSVEELYAKNIRIDAIYLDNNVSEDTREVQITGVDYSDNTYLNHETSADILLQSSYDTNAVLTVKRGDEVLKSSAVSLNRGYNVINFELPTDTAGTYDYSVSVKADEDHSPYNNDYGFTQIVSSSLKVLFVSSSEADLEAARTLYGADAEITAYVNDPNVPYVLEDICLYDEIMLSNVDVRELNNYISFIDCIDKAVSLYGKSLVTVGDTKIQNKSDDVLKQLEDMLPVVFGNSARDEKLYTIVIDVSRSIFQASRFTMAKQAAIQLLYLLRDTDKVAVICYHGEVEYLVYPPTDASEREEIARKINDLTVKQGTFMGRGLYAAYELMKGYDNYDDKEVMVIGDGLPYDLEPDDPVTTAEKMKADGIIVSAINTACPEGVMKETMQKTAAAGGGQYYYIEREEQVTELILGEVADDFTDSVIELESPVHIKKKAESIVAGISSLPNTFGYVHSKAKASATTVLTVDYTKASGVTVEVPLYTYWDYGNGKVVSYTGGISGSWAQGWMDGNSGHTVLSRLIGDNTPETRNDDPYLLTVEYDGLFSNIELIPSIINANADVTVDITLPDGTVITQELIFDSQKYFYEFATALTGKYSIHVTYTYGEAPYTRVFESDSFFNISFSPEYDSFAVFDPSSLYSSVGNRGQVSEDGRLNLENDEKDIGTYVVEYTIPFLIAALALYVADIIIRKIKWNDIKSLFKKT